MGPITTGLGEIFQYTLEVSPEYADKYTDMDLRTYQDWIVKRQMAMLKGVVEVNSFGGKVKQYEVSLEPADSLNSRIFPPMEDTLRRPPALSGWPDQLPSAAPSIAGICRWHNILAYVYLTKLQGFIGL